MNRRTSNAAEAAAAAASEAARVLQARSTESRAAAQSKVEPTPAPKANQQPEPANIEKNDLIRPAPRNPVRAAALAEMQQLEDERRGVAEPKAPEPVAADPLPPTPEDMLHPQAKPDAEAEPAAAQPVVAAPAPETIKTVRVKVDGQEFDAPQDDVEAAGGIKPYQIMKAAEHRMEKANKLLADAHRAAAAINEQAARANPPKPAESDEQFIAARIDTIRFGSPEEATKAHMEILQRTNKQMDPNDLMAQVRNQMRHDAAVEAFGKEFEDVTTNPLLQKLVVSLARERAPALRQAQQSGPIDWGTFYRTIGNEIRSTIGRPSQPATVQAAVPQTAGTPSPTSDKEARKASILNLPTASARAELPKDSKPETREDILNEARRRRGQPIG